MTSLTRDPSRMTSVHPCSSAVASESRVQDSGSCDGRQSRSTCWHSFVFGNRHRGCDESKSLRARSRPDDSRRWTELASPMVRIWCLCNRWHLGEPDGFAGRGTAGSLAPSADRCEPRAPRYRNIRWRVHPDHDGILTNAGDARLAVHTRTS